MDQARTVVPIFPGMVFAYAAASAPTGYLLCDGSAISRTAYPELFALLGVTHGQGNGSTTFNVPDYRGRFLRGVDGGVARDPDAASRTAMNTGGNTGNNVGSVQSSQYASHTHTQNAHSHGLRWNNGGTSGAAREMVSATSGSVGTIDTELATAVNQNSGGNETRPINANVQYIIKT